VEQESTGRSLEAELGPIPRRRCKVASGKIDCVESASRSGCLAPIEN
jgi:hypothetical protein